MIRLTFNELNAYDCYWCPSALFLVYLFILRNRDRMWVGKGQREGERERIPGRFHAVSTEPYMGLNLTTHEIMTWAETKSQTPYWATQVSLNLYLNLSFVDFFLCCLGKLLNHFWNFLKKYLFVLRERGYMNKRGKGREREGDRES